MFISKRKHEPAHYMLNIDSFSILSEAITSKIESDVFEASGHKWSNIFNSFDHSNDVFMTFFNTFSPLKYLIRRLDLYPNGNDEENGAGHISLYVVICDTESCSKGWEVCVDVCFFVYDHIHQNYVTFQDGNGRRTRFHEKKKTWGFDKLIPLESFVEDKNGYLLNDSCVFGVEVFAVPEFTKMDRCLLMTKPPATMNTHTWTINNFSGVTENVLYSEVFKVGKVKWKLKLYPNGNKPAEGTHLSIYLGVHDAASFPDGWKVYAKFKLRLKKQGTESDIEKETVNWFCNSAEDWGFTRFLLLSELNDSENGFLVNDNLTFEVEIPVMGTLRYFV